MKKILPILLVIVIFAAGMGVMLYPTIANYVNSRSQTVAIKGACVICWRYFVRVLRVVVDDFPVHIAANLFHAINVRAALLVFVQRCRYMLAPDLHGGHGIEAKTRGYVELAKQAWVLSKQIACVVAYVFPRLLNGFNEALPGA